jgi:hypothetical protein
MEDAQNTLLGRIFGRSDNYGCNGETVFWSSPTIAKVNN